MNFFGKQCLRVLQNEIKNRSLPCHIRRDYCFKSAVSLDKLYPKSNQKLYTPSFTPPTDPQVKFTGYIPIDKLKITYSGSSGPGGQNVNCVNTKVDVRFEINSATWLSEEIKTKLKEHKNRINKEGYFIIKSDLTRSQHLNLADALEKLRTIIRASAVVPAEPSPESMEKKRKNLLKAARERLHEKRARSQLKQHRRVSMDD